MSLDGTENAYVLHKELGEWMTQNVTVVRYNDKLKETDNKILELMERYKKININDTAKWSNQGAAFTRQLQNMLQLARVITIGALNRDESRGAHFKPDFPERDDEKFMKQRWLHSMTEMLHQNSIIKMLMCRLFHRVNATTQETLRRGSKKWLKIKQYVL